MRGRRRRRELGDDAIVDAGVDREDRHRLRGTHALAEDAAFDVAACRAVADDDDASVIDVRDAVECAFGRVEEVGEVEARPHHGRAGREACLSGGGEDERRDAARGDQWLDHGSKIAIGRAEPRVHLLVGVHPVEEHHHGKDRAALDLSRCDVGEAAAPVTGMEKAPLFVRERDRRACRTRLGRPLGGLRMAVRPHEERCARERGGEQEPRHAQPSPNTASPRAPSTGLRSRGRGRVCGRG